VQCSFSGLARRIDESRRDNDKKFPQQIDRAVLKNGDLEICLVFGCFGRYILMTGAKVTSDKY